MTLQAFLDKLTNAPATVTFTDTVTVIDALYEFTPTAFKNGDVENAAGQNSGSCKLFAFARMQEFTPAQTLNCFGDYYRVDVLQNPYGTDHANIRSFMRHGWAGVVHAGEPLRRKAN